MRRSNGHILTTHVGSLPRPKSLLGTLRAIEARQEIQEQQFRRDVQKAVFDVVSHQIDIGLDIIADGEMGKTNFINYVNQRLSGFVEPKPSSIPAQWAKSREVQSFPEFYSWFESLNPDAPRPRRMTLECQGPISYTGHELLAIDIANLRNAIGTRDIEAFMPSISPATIAGYHRNAFYESDEAFLFAIAEAIGQEYKAIVDAGFILQIDDPRLVTHYLRTPGLSVEEWQRWAAVRIDAINHALKGIPTDRVRHHTCYGINMGPRVHDLEMKHVIGLVLRINAGAYSFEAGNPRHEHEWQLWRKCKLPDEKILIPGLVTHSTYVVEHPELVAQRIERFAKIVGRERVIAGTDCGFASTAIAEEMPPSLVDAKLRALVEGARTASESI